MQPKTEIAQVLAKQDLQDKPKPKTKEPIEALIKRREIHRISRRGDLDALKQVLLSVPDLINALNIRGENPLHLAIVSGDLGSVQFLIQKKASLSQREKETGMTPLHYVAAFGTPQMMALFVKETTSLGLNIFEVDTMGRTIFHIAAKRANAEQLHMLQYLLNDRLYIPLVTMLDSKGRTILHTAAGNGYIVAVQMILKLYPFLLHYTDKQGETPLKMVYRRAQNNLLDFKMAAELVTLLGQKMNEKAVRTVDKINKPNQVMPFQHIHNGFSHRIYQDYQVLGYLKKEYATLNKEHHQPIFVTAGYLVQLFVHREDLVSNLLEPMLNIDGTVSTHYVKVLFQGQGLRVVAVLPIEVTDGQPFDIKLVFYGERNLAHTLQDIRTGKISSLIDHLEKIQQELTEVIKESRKTHPKSPLSLSCIGHGFGGIDAQYCAHAVLQRIKKKDEILELFKTLTVITINSPHVGEWLTKESLALASELNKINGFKVQSYHLTVDGSLVPLLGYSYVFGNKTEEVEVNSVVLRGTTLTESMKKLLMQVQHLEDRRGKVKENAGPIEKRKKELELEITQHKQKIEEDRKTKKDTLLSFGLKAAETLISGSPEKRLALAQQELISITGQLDVFEAENKTIRENLERAQGEFRQLMGTCFNMPIQFNQNQIVEPSSVCQFSAQKLSQCSNLSLETHEVLLKGYSMHQTKSQSDKASNSSERKIAKDKPARGPGFRY